jgi:hypothetical protein
VWYCIRARDDLDNVTYFPSAADPSDPEHTGGAGDYLTFSVLPLFPDGYSGTRVLLVNGYPSNHYHWAYDWAECLGEMDRRRPLVDLYGQTLTDAGYCYDIYDIGGAGTAGPGIHPAGFDYYNAVIWFTGDNEGSNSSLIDSTAQSAIRDYLATGGKLVLCGDRLALNMEICPPDMYCGNGDALGGDFIYGVMGCNYLDEMGSPFTRPYVYCKGVDSVYIFGVPTEVDFDSLLVYRECPYTRDMSWVKAETGPPAGFVVQPLLDVLNPDVPVAHNAIYTEYQFAGQCVFVNFDLSASVNHEQTYCISPAPGVPPYDSEAYEGRVDLIRLILEDIFGLEPPGGGTAGTGRTADEPEAGFSWALARTSPNPFARTTQIAFEVAKPCRVRLAVYNMRGQVVRVLVDGVVEAGPHRTSWDGRSEAGGLAASGVYFCRMDAAGYTATRKMLLLR